MVELPTVVPRVDDRDWSGLTLGERVRQIEVEGYLLVPDLLTEEQIARLKEQVATLQTGGMDYSEHQRTAGDVMFLGGEITELAAHPVIIPFLTSLLGEDIICMSGAYARSEPGHPGMVLHTDYDGDSAPIEAVRVLYYLTDLTPETSPFRVIPRSHLSMHSDGNPFKRYLEHPDEVMVNAKAGSAVLINFKVFHANYPNKSSQAREMIAYMYRPAWCGPGTHTDPWDPDKLAKLPPHVMELFGDPNTHYDDFSRGNRPPGMAHDAPGISPHRWDRTQQPNATSP